MEENKSTINLDLENLHEDITHRIYKSTMAVVKYIIRRVLEIVVSLIGLIVLLPLTIVVFFQNLKNKDYGKIFYVQERIGKNGKIFKMYKFRTMVENSEEILEAMLQDKELKKEYETYRKLKNDTRLTKFGKFLRKTSLDEVPQFINVLKGDMALVGPRPYLPEEKERMGAYYKYIIQHKPGITGVYQISGKQNIEFLDRLDMDIRYHYKNSLRLDIKIAIITVLITLVRKETYKVGDVTFDTIGYISKGFTLFLKRIIDIIGALFGIALLIPLTAIVAIVNFINKENGPLFYSQERIGKDGKHFKMYKFRSMVVGADDVLEDLLKNNDKVREEFNKYRKLKDDPRITKIGKFLRKTSLDEFPQFINVLKGEMSLVGPRAYLPCEKEYMQNAYEYIIKCKPGITGLWQVSGRNNLLFEERLDLDIEYYNKTNLVFDTNILFRTIKTVLKKEGAV